MFESRTAASDFEGADGVSGATHASQSRLFDALRQGALGAIDTAEKILPQAGEVAAKGCERMAFVAVFAAVFPAALAVQLVPAPIKVGGRRGLATALRVAERVANLGKRQ